MIRRFGPSFGSAVPLQGHNARMGTCFTDTDITIRYVFMYGFIIMFILKVYEAVNLNQLHQN